jgi:hypothetical protein
LRDLIREAKTKQSVTQFVEQLATQAVAAIRSPDEPGQLGIVTYYRGELKRDGHEPPTAALTEARVRQLIGEEMGDLRETIKALTLAVRGFKGPNPAKRSSA